MQMGKQQQGVSSSCFTAKKRKNLKKSKEFDSQESQTQAFTGLQPLFSKHRSYSKKPDTSSTISGSSSSRATERVLMETRSFYENWVRKINSAGADHSRIPESADSDSRNNVVFDGLLPPFREKPVWSKKKPSSSRTIAPSTVASRIPGMVTKELKLFDDSWVAKNSPDHYSRNKKSAEEFERKVGFNLKKMRMSYSFADMLEEESRGVSTLLSLYHNDPFKIKKKMEPSDLGNLCRLLLSTDLVEKHILPFFNVDQIKLVEVADQEDQEINGLNVWVWDMNTESNHQLVFKGWSSTKTYIFNNGWTKHFVIRRNLIEGDEIGLYWDNDHSRFNFSVLSRDPAGTA